MQNATQFDTNQYEDVGQDVPRALKSTGPAKESLEPATIETVETPIDPEWAERMAFADEPVTIMVHESTEKFAEKIVEVYVNTIPQYFIRGRDQVVKRKFLEMLARAKLTTYSQEKVRDYDGNESYKMVPHTALKYPFTVIEDKNPKGRDWLKAVLSEA